jgi:hypothetical protein
MVRDVMVICSQRTLPDDLAGLATRRYRLGDRIGTGAISDYYVAQPANRDPDPSNQLVIRALTRPAAEQAELVEGFVADARSLATVRHERIGIVDFETIDASARFAMVFAVTGDAVSLYELVGYVAHD